MAEEMEQGEMQSDVRRSRGGEEALRVSARAYAFILPWAVLVILLSGVGVAHAEDDAKAGRDGPAQVRMDLLAFFEAEGGTEGNGPDTSIMLPPLAAFEFDSSRYAGSVRTELTSRMEPPYRGRVAVTVSLFAGERLIKRAIVSPYVQVGEQVVVAARDLRRGEILSQQDLQVVERDQARLAQGFFGQVEDVVGTRMRRSLRRGRVILASATEEVPVVERGDRVIVVLESGAMKLQSIGRAQEAGVIGEWIRVINLDSKKELSGRLDRAGRVHVSF